MVSHNLDQDRVSEVNYCENYLRLKNYVRVLLMELKSSQQIIKILHEDQRNSYILKSQETSQNLISRDSAKVTGSRMKEEKAKHKIQILGDNHARGLANEFKYEIQGVIKPGSTLVNLVNTTPSDLKTLSKSDVCIVWGWLN
jgi:hypothetical protein